MIEDGIYCYDRSSFMSASDGEASGYRVDYYGDIGEWEVRRVFEDKDISDLHSPLDAFEELFGYKMELDESKLSYIDPQEENDKWADEYGEDALEPFSEDGTPVIAGEYDEDGRPFANWDAKVNIQYRDPNRCPFLTWFDSQID